MPRRRSDYEYWEHYEPSRPLRADGIKAKSQRGKFASSWWATRWIDALERLMDAGRLSRGRSYARNGQVLNLEIGAGHVTARVQGSRPSPYKVRIDLAPLADGEWERAIDAMAEQAIFAAKLLNGEMPENIEEAFAEARVQLFPASGSDLVTSCSCPDYANPCKHIAAVYFLLGERFDEDPFLLFELRGRSKPQVIAALRAYRATAPAVAESTPVYAVEPEPDGVPLVDELARFWVAGPDLADFRVKVAAPAVNLALLKRLGPPPVEAAARRPRDGGSPMDRLSATYTAITDAALEKAYAA
jgi:uncharacterized Zn finger protein